MWGILKQMSESQPKTSCNRTDHGRPAAGIGHTYKIMIQRKAVLQSFKRYNAKIMIAEHGKDVKIRSVRLAAYFKNS